MRSIKCVSVPSEDVFVLAFGPFRRGAVVRSISFASPDVGASFWRFGLATASNLPRTGSVGSATEFSQLTQLIESYDFESGTPVSPVGSDEIGGRFPVGVKYDDVGYLCVALVNINNVPWRVSVCVEADVVECV